MLIFIILLKMRVIVYIKNCYGGGEFLIINLAYITQV